MAATTWNSPTPAMPSVLGGLRIRIGCHRGRNFLRLIDDRPSAVHGGTRALAAIAFLVLLSGCAGGILDPAPYAPQNDNAVLNSMQPPYSPLGVLTFTDPADAAQKLLALSSGTPINGMI